MRRSSALFAVVLVVAGLVGGIRAASAHQCPEGDTSSPECRDTTVYEDWRPNAVPLFDLADREEQGEGTDGEQQRHDAQRWRAECEDSGEYRQECAWVYGGQSIMEYDSDEGVTGGPEGGLPTRPNELHAGFAATHCFLAEGAHDCDTHGDEDEFATHDSHGGAIYVDVCLAENADSYWCNDGVEDTQAGVTIVDHLPCPAGCFDEYHVVRPADAAYTEDQMTDSGEAVEAIATDPYTQVCGYPGHSECE